MLKEIPGDPKITTLFGFPGFEALIVTMVKHLAALRKEAGLTAITYKKFVAEIETEMAAIIKASEDKEE